MELSRLGKNIYLPLHTTHTHTYTQHTHAHIYIQVDAWMSRADLEAGLLGWNAVDATPQESSSLDREMTMGPAFVPWIKKNKVDHEKMYDAPFVLGEVNAVHRFPNGDDRTDVGRKIVTKAAGTNQRGRWGEHTLNDKYKVCATPFGTVDGESCTDEGMYYSLFFLLFQTPTQLSLSLSLSLSPTHTRNTLRYCARNEL